ncbi:MAG TPA: hypothetical protein VF533_19845 [Solirubrobacteraceae bacterium]|jgi:hypothetical protein
MNRPVGVPSDTPSWRAGRHEDVVARARGWLASPALEELLDALQAPSPARAGPQALRAWSASALDTRRGAERRDAAVATWPPDWVQALLQAAGPLGLRRTAPPTRRSYDCGLVLGGATTGNRLRVTLAAELVETGTHFDELAGLSAERPLSAREHESELDSADDQTEWRNLARYLHRAFGPLRESSSDRGGAGWSGWRDEALRDAEGHRLRLLVAPAPDPERRAGTADAVRFFLSRTSVERRSSVLVLTSAIYAPYQFFTAAPLLLKGGVRDVELIGTPTADEGAPNLLAQRLGQEMHAAIEAASRLVAALPARAQDNA